MMETMSAALLWRKLCLQLWYDGNYVCSFDMMETMPADSKTMLTEICKMMSVIINILHGMVSHIVLPKRLLFTEWIFKFEFEFISMTHAVRFILSYTTVYEHRVCWSNLCSFINSKNSMGFARCIKLMCTHQDWSPDTENQNKSQYSYNCSHLFQRYSRVLQLGSDKCAHWPHLHRHPHWDREKRHTHQCLKCLFLVDICVMLAKVVNISTQQKINICLILLRKQWT